MTARKHQKRRARARAARTGEPYSTALRHVRRDRQEDEVSDIEMADEPVLASCSFCKKNNREVTRLVAGPGVYICNECVALCGQLVAQETTPEQSAKARADFLNRTPEEILASLPALARTAEEVEDEVRRWVYRLREMGTGWDAIGAATGLSEDGARRRFEPS
jgi:ClpX C4-type zinc finger